MIVVLVVMATIMVMVLPSMKESERKQAKGLQTVRDWLDFLIH